MGTKLIRPAKCCSNCRRHTMLLIKRFLLPRIKQMRCPFMGQDVAPTQYCSRFRWAAGCRPPTPEKPAKVPTTEQMPPQEVSDV